MGFGIIPVIRMHLSAPPGQCTVYETLNDQSDCSILTAALYSKHWSGLLTYQGITTGTANMGTYVAKGGSIGQRP